LAIYEIPTRGFAAAVSVFGGTPPPKPLDCKIRLNTLGAHFLERWADPTGGEPRLSRATFIIVSIDIIEMSPSSQSQFIHLSVRVLIIRGKQKTLLALRLAGFGEIYGFSLYLLASRLFHFDSRDLPRDEMDKPRLNTLLRPEWL
jgi:hypothetical protein